MDKADSGRVGFDDLSYFESRRKAEIQEIKNSRRCILVFWLVTFGFVFGVVSGKIQLPF